MADGIAIRLGTEAHPVDYTSEEERLLAQILGMPGAATRARAGIRPGGGLEVTVGETPEKAIIQPGCGIITDPARGAGSYLFAIPSVVKIGLATRPASGQSRLDEVVVRILNVDAQPGDGVNEVDIELITGGASAGTPTAPTVAAGKLQLNELAVPASGSVTVQKRGPRTTGLGGVLPVASQAERDAIEVVYDGLIVYREDLKVFEVRVNGAWDRLVRRGEVFKGTTVCTGDGDSVTGLTTITFPADFQTLLGGGLPIVRQPAVVGAGAHSYIAGIQDLTTSSAKVAVRRLDGGVIANGGAISVHYGFELP